MIFELCVQQGLLCAHMVDSISIHAIMTVKHCKHHPYQRLPNVHTILHFGGDLLTIQNMKLSLQFIITLYFTCQCDEVYKLQF